MPAAGDRPAGEDDHHRAVSGGDVPAVQLQPVARPEGDVLVRGPEPRGRHDRARRMREHVGGGDRHDEDDEDDQAGEGEQQPPPVSAREPVVRTPGPPERHHAETEEHDAGCQREKPRVVVARGADLDRVVDGLARADRDPEDPERERNRRAGSGADVRVEPREPEQDRERNQAADEVVTGGGSWLRLQKVVVEDVERDQADRSPRDRELRPRDLPGTRGGGGNGERGDGSTLRISVESHKTAPNAAIGLGGRGRRASAVRGRRGARVPAEGSRPSSASCGL